MSHVTNSSLKVLIIHIHYFDNENNVKDKDKKQGWKFYSAVKSLLLYSL